MNSRRARIHSFWALILIAFYISACYADWCFGMDMVMFAPLNLSLGAVIAGLATQIRYRVRS